MKLRKRRFSLLIFIAVLALALFAGVLTACSSKTNNPTVDVENYVTTTRMELPTDSSLPTQHTAIENIAYMATALDNAPFYHAYALNSSKSSGYEQVTKTWKDYKSGELNGTGTNVLISSDLSYSALVKFASQKVHYGEDTFVRSGGKPNKNSTPTQLEWNTDDLQHYSKGEHLAKFGEFSTELTVFCITAETIKSEEPVKDNGDGTYSLSVSLNADSARWYAYLMRTNGGLKTLPEFQKIDLEFTFDSGWRVLKTVCNEVEKISPKALGGISMQSTAKTTTTFSYEQSDFDEEHFGYFDSFFKDNLNVKDDEEQNVESGESSELLDVLGGGFSEVVNAEGNGQKFGVDLNIGSTKYNGKVYAKLGDMSDILGSLEVRLALEKENSGRQDLYVEFTKGKLNVFYSNDFALNADISAIGNAVGGFNDFIKRFSAEHNEPLPVAQADEAKASLDVGTLLNSLKMKENKYAATIQLDTDDLLGIGLGVKLQFNFRKTTDELGDTSYAFGSLLLGGLYLNGESLDVYGTVYPDEFDLPQRECNETSASLTDYISGIAEMLNSPSLAFDLAIDGEKSTVSYLDGVRLNATANAYLSNVIKVAADIGAEYEGVTLKLKAYYEIDIKSGGYGKAYLNVYELAGEKTDIKVCVDIKDAVTEIKSLISAIAGDESTPETAKTGKASSGLSKILQTVINLNFSKIISGLKADSSQISVSLNVDEILSAFGLEVAGVSLGNADIKLTYDGLVCALGLDVKGLGLSLGIGGSKTEVTAPDGNYLNINDALKLVTDAAMTVTDVISAKSAAFELGGTLTVDGVSLALKGEGEADWNDDFAIAFEGKVSISEDDKKDSLDIKVYYKNGLIKLYVNDLGFSFTAKESEQYASAFSTVGTTQKVGNATAAQATYANGLGADSLTEILENGKIQQLISEVFKALGNVSLKLDSINSEDINSLIIDYVTDGVKNFGATITAEGKLALSLDILNGGTGVLGGNVEIQSGNGTKIAEFEKLTPNYVATKDNLIKTIYTYLFAVIEDISVENVLNGDTFKVDLALDGTLSAIPALNENNVKAAATLKYAQNGKSKLLGVDFDVSFDLPIEGSENTVGVAGAVMYSDEYFFLEVNSIKFNNLEFDLAVKCKASISDVYSAVEFVLGLMDTTVSEDAASYAKSAGVAGVLEGIFTFDFNKAFKFYKDDSKNVFALETDYVLSLLGVDLGFEIGGVTVAVNPETHAISADIKYDGKKWAEVNAYTAEVNEYDNFDGSAYVDLAEVVNTVLTAKGEVEDIIDSKDVTFTADLKFKFGSTAISFKGEGEVDFAESKNISAAVKATLKLGEKSYGAWFVYEKAGVKFILSGEGFEENPIVLTFKKEEAEKVQSTFALLSKANTVPVSTYSEVGDLITSLTTDERIAKIVSSLCEFLNGISITSDSDIKLTHDKFALRFVSIENKGLSLEITSENDSVSGNLAVSSGNKTVYTDIYNVVSEYESTDISSLSALADQILDLIEDSYKNLSLKDLLGDETYAVTLDLSGENSAISALKDISATAEIKVSQPESGKIMHFGLNMEIKGTPVELSAYLTDEKIYLSLDKLGNIDLNGLKFSASISNIKQVVSDLIHLITHADIESLIKDFTGDTKSAAVSSASATFANPQTASGVVGIITSILSIDFDEIFSYIKDESGKTEVLLDVDGIVSLFTDKVKIGKLTAEAKDGEFNAALAVEGSDPYLTLTAQKIDETVTVTESDYLNADFISSVVKDVKNTLTDANGNVYRKFTFTGNAKINVNVSVINVNISIDLISLTIGIENGDFYISLVGQLHKSTAIGFTVTEERAISITYSGGYITLGRDLNTAKQSFKVLTLEYLLDTLTSAEESPVRWLLGTSTNAWSTIFNFVKLDVHSGLTKPRDYYYYDKSSIKSISSLNIWDYVTSLYVNTNDVVLCEKTNNHTEMNELKNKFGKDCYAAGVDLSSVINLFDYLYVGLVRDKDTSGDYRISGLKLFTKIKGMVGVELDLSNYLEGETKEYGIESATFTQAEVASAEEMFTAYEEVELTAETYKAGEYYYLNEENNYAISEGEFNSAVAYYKKANHTYYVKNGTVYTLATEFDENATYYTVSMSSSTQLGSVAAPNYYKHLKGLINFDEYKDQPAVDRKTPIFGCATLTDVSYIGGAFGATVKYASSDVLETVTLTIVSESGDSLDIIEARYGSTVYLYNNMYPQIAEVKDGKTYVYKYKQTDIVNEIVLDGDKQVTRIQVEAFPVNLVTGIVGADKTVYLTHGEAFGNLDVSGKVFLGWYKEASFTTRVSAWNGEETVYGKFVVAEEVVNGVTYAYDFDKGCYFVSSFSSGTLAANGYYYNSENQGNNVKWLVLENTIHGVPVGYIADGALQNKDNDNHAETSLVNVVVPQNVTEVGQRAFTDNKHLKKVVFLADTVYFHGNIKDKTTPFYGCWTDGYIHNKVNTNFTVYFKNAQSENDTLFNCYTETWKGQYSVTRNNDSWQYLDITAEGDADNIIPDLALNGLCLTSKADFVSLVQERVDAATLNSSYSAKNVYKAEIADEFVVGYNKVTVKLTKQSESEWISSITVTIHIQGDSESYTYATTKNADVSELTSEKNAALTAAQKGNIYAWYSDENLTTRIDTLTESCDVYGRLNTQTVNGVVYAFEEDGAQGHYFVKGRASGIAEYENKDVWLKLENTILGLPVTRIGNNAFENANDDAAHSLVKVIVPQNVTEVGLSAFKNNKALQTVVFLANTPVKFVGECNSSTKTSPFYGITDITTNVYVKGVTEDSSADWKRVYHGNYNIVNVNMLWVYVKFNVTITVGSAVGDDTIKNLLDLSSLTSTMTKSDLEEAIKSKVDAITLADATKFNNSKRVYSVSVSAGIENGYNDITVTLTENANSLWQKPLTVIVKNKDDEEITSFEAIAGEEVGENSITGYGLNYYTDNTFTTAVEKFNDPGMGITELTLYLKAEKRIQVVIKNENGNQVYDASGNPIVHSELVGGPVGSCNITGYESTYYSDQSCTTPYTGTYPESELTLYVKWNTETSITLIVNNSKGNLNETLSTEAKFGDTIGDCSIQGYHTKYYTDTTFKTVAETVGLPDKGTTLTVYARIEYKFEYSSIRSKGHVYVYDGSQTHYSPKCENIKVSIYEGETISYSITTDEQVGDKSGWYSKGTVFVVSMSDNEKTRKEIKFYARENFFKGFDNSGVAIESSGDIVHNSNGNKEISISELKTVSKDTTLILNW